MPNSRKRTILIIDDERTIREQSYEFFKDHGWDAIKASGGKVALRLLKNKLKWSCNCIILDKKMPEMDGLSFLRTLREQESGANPIPVIVLSAFVPDEADKKTFFNHGATWVFQKPQDTSLLAAVVEAIILSPKSKEQRKIKDKRNIKIKAEISAHEIDEKVKQQREIEIKAAISAHEIDEKVKQHEDVLENYYKSKILEQNPFFKKIKEPLFVVARRWNSWYPSFFDVPGGSYAMVFPMCKETRRNRISVIDPGFRFLKILGELGLSVQDIETCIVTHNHPDHMGGVFEYIACRYQAGKPASFLCNSSTQKILSVMTQATVISSVLPGNNRAEDIFRYTDSKGKFRSLGVSTFATDHREIGWDSDSKGLVLSSNSRATREAQDSTFRTVILGDTAFDQTNPDMDFPSVIARDENTKIVVLHIGSAQVKQRSGGHLYLTGLGRLVQQLAFKLEGFNRNNKLIVLVSEWGLEHANASQMKIICPDADGFDETSTIFSTISFIRNNLKEFGYNRLIILPADIGLIVGMESGLVYLKSLDGKVDTVPADQVTFTPTKDGLQYSRTN